MDSKLNITIEFHIILPTDILGMDGKMAPQDKLSCLVKCCKIVFNMLQISHSEPASADDFLPCLIYICLKANPPRIQSNINFITRFCNEDKLRMGEAGYFFANLVRTEKKKGL